MNEIYKYKNCFLQTLIIKFKIILGKESSASLKTLLGNLGPKKVQVYCLVEILSLENLNLLKKDKPEWLNNVLLIINFAFEFIRNDLESLSQLTN